MGQWIGIMQPYFFPYVGYFQLLKQCDVFVLYDDVNFIKRGWVNRNRILVNQEPNLLTVPCKKASQNKFINQIKVNLDKKSLNKILNTIRMAYQKAPFFDHVYPLARDVLTAGDETIGDLSSRSIRAVVHYLDLPVEIKKSSAHYSNWDMCKADRLIDICHQEGIANYVNALGGKEIYTKRYFKNKGINLYFLVPEAVPYKQFQNDFVPWLSILDVLMFNDVSTVKDHILNAYQLE